MKDREKKLNDNIINIFKEINRHLTIYCISNHLMCRYNVPKFRASPQNLRTYLGLLKSKGLIGGYRKSNQYWYYLISKDYSKIKGDR